jgi:hypothetical protein
MMCAHADKRRTHTPDRPQRANTNPTTSPRVSTNHRHCDTRTCPDRSRDEEHGARRERAAAHLSAGTGSRRRPCHPFGVLTSQPSECRRALPGPRGATNGAGIGRERPGMPSVFARPVAPEIPQMSIGAPCSRPRANVHCQCAICFWRVGKPRWPRLSRGECPRSYTHGPRTALRVATLAIVVLTPCNIATSDIRSATTLSPRAAR